MTASVRARTSSKTALFDRRHGRLLLRLYIKYSRGWIQNLPKNYSKKHGKNSITLNLNWCQFSLAIHQWYISLERNMIIDSLLEHYPFSPWETPLQLSHPYIYHSKKQHLVSWKISMPRPGCQHHLLCLNALRDRSHKHDNLILVRFGNGWMHQPGSPVWANDDSFCFQFSLSSSSFY